MNKSKDFVVFVAFFTIMILVNVMLLATGSIKWGWEGIGIMVGAGFTIAIFSFLYGDNPLFKLAEHFYAGVATSYLFVVYWYSTLLPDVVFGLKDLFKEPMSLVIFGKIVAILVPTILGLMVYTRFFPKIAWLSRIPFAVIIGFGAGLAIPNYIVAYILQQAQPTMVPLWNSNGLDVGAIIIFVGVISTLVYFFFSLEHKGALGLVARLGIFFLMVAFGASFGFTVMARMSLLIERVDFLFRVWIPLIAG